MTYWGAWECLSDFYPKLMIYLSNERSVHLDMTKDDLEDEIEKLIDKLNPSKSAGPNGIPVFILKNVQTQCVIVQIFTFYVTLFYFVQRCRKLK